MPKIPTYQRRLSIPGETGNVPMDINSAGVVEKAKAGMGLALSQSAQGVNSVIAIHQEKLRQQDIANKTLITGAAYDDEERAYEQSERQLQGQDAYENINRGTKFRDDSIKKYTTDIQDPELKLRIENHIRSRSRTLLDSLAVHQAKQREEVTKQAVEGVQAGALKDAYSGKDLEDTLNTFRDAVKAQHDTGARGTENAVEILTKGEAAIAEAHLDGIINRNPTAGIAEIKTGKYNQFLPQKKIEEFDQKAKTLQEALKKDFESQQKETERLTKEKIKLDREATGNDFVNRTVAGKLTRADILKSNLEPTGENSKQYWINQIEQIEKKASTGVDTGFKTDKTLDARLFSQIVKDPASITEGQIVDYIGNGLSRGSADSLITERRQRLNPQKDPARTAAEAAIVENLRRDRKTGIFGEDQAGDIEYAKQIDAFRRWSKYNPDTDPSEYYEKVMEPVKKSFIFDFLSKDKPEPKKKREAMEKAGEIPQRRSTDKKTSSTMDIQVTPEEAALPESALIQRLQGGYNVPYEQAKTMAKDIKAGKIPKSTPTKEEAIAELKRRGKL